MKDQEYDYFYDDEQDAKYCYPGTNVLKNKLDIRDSDTLHEAERDYSAVRQAELVNQGVTGDFSFKHLCSIHKHLFSDVYSWAGKTRTVDISKGTIFCLVQFIESQFDDLYRNLKKENFLADITDKEEMSKRLQNVIPYMTDSLYKVAATALWNKLYNSISDNQYILMYRHTRAEMSDIRYSGDAA